MQNTCKNRCHKTSGNNSAGKSALQPFFSKETGTFFTQNLSEHFIQGKLENSKTVAGAGNEEKQADLVSEKYVGNERLQNAFDNSPLLKIGECNEGVRLIQEGLVADGFAMPKSTLENGEMDGNFGTETYNTIMNFQTKHHLSRDGILGHNTLGQLDDLAIQNKLTSTEHTAPLDCKPIAKKPKPKKPKHEKPKECSMHAVYANERNVSFCAPTSCGTAVQFDIKEITRTGQNCPSDFDGKRLDERVSIDINNTTCPSKPQVVTGSCPINKNGTLTNCTDTYGVCFPKKMVADFMEFGLFNCKAIMKQELMIDGKIFEVRTIQLNVNFHIDFNDPLFISCSGFANIK